MQIIVFLTLLLHYVNPALCAVNLHHFDIHSFFCVSLLINLIKLKDRNKDQEDKEKVRVIVICHSLHLGHDSALLEGGSDSKTNSSSFLPEANAQLRHWPAARDNLCNVSHTACPSHCAMIPITSAPPL